MAGLWGVCPEAAEREWDNARAARGPVPWAGDAPNVIASRSLTHRGEEERTRRRRRTTGRGGGRAPSDTAVTSSCIVCLFSAQAGSGRSMRHILTAFLRRRSFPLSPHAHSCQFLLL